MIKLIVMDMDGTLLDDKDTITKDTKEALITCEKMGIKLILASGRLHTRLFKYAKQLEMFRYGGKLIEVNGMAIYDLASNKREVIKRISKDEIKEIFEFVKPFYLETQAYFDGGIEYFIPEEVMPLIMKEREERNLSDDMPILGGPWSWNHDSRDGYPDQRRIYDIDELHLPFYNKFTLTHDPDIIKKYLPSFLERFSNFEIVRSCPRLVEIMPKGISKGNALRSVMEEEGYSEDEVMVFGDGENDITMFDHAYYSFAMENAIDEVKKRARYIAPRNTEEGLCKMIKRYVLNSDEPFDRSE